jgi:hypothetical protein
MGETKVVIILLYLTLRVWCQGLLSIKMRPLMGETKQTPLV